MRPELLIPLFPLVAFLVVFVTFKWFKLTPPKTYRKDAPKSPSEIRGYFSVGQQVERGEIMLRLKDPNQSPLR